MYRDVCVQEFRFEFAVTDLLKINYLACNKVLIATLCYKVPDANTQDIATKLKRQKLYEMYPGIDPVALEEVFQANR